MGDNVISVCREHLRIIGMDESRVVKGLFHAMPFPEGHFDTVICQEGFEHFFSPPLLMHEIRRVLQPGGGFTGSTPHRNAVDDPLHIVYFEEYGMRNLLETAGFEVVDLRIGPSCFATDEPTQILWKARKKT
jgi:ubiquinone/menaquinone biosynthesis C-methylase UbiE